MWSHDILVQTPQCWSRFSFDPTFKLLFVVNLHFVLHTRSHFSANGILQLCELLPHWIFSRVWFDSVPPRLYSLSRWVFVNTANGMSQTRSHIVVPTYPMLFMLQVTLMCIWFFPVTYWFAYACLSLSLEWVSYPRSVKYFFAGLTFFKAGFFYAEEQSVKVDRFSCLDIRITAGGFLSHEMSSCTREARLAFTTLGHLCVGVMPPVDQRSGINGNSDDCAVVPLRSRTVDSRCARVSGVWISLSS